MASKNIKGITIEFGANTTELDKALGAIDKDSKKVSSDIKEIDGIMKKNGESAVLWQQKQELLTKELENSKKKLELLEQAQEEVSQQFKNKKIDEGQYRAFQLETEKARLEVQKYASDVDTANEKLKEIGAAASKSGDKIYQSLQNVQEKSKSTASEIKQIDSELKKAPNSVELWERKQKLLTEGIENSDKKLKLLIGKQYEVSQQFKNKEIDEGQYHEFQQNIELAKNELSNLETELKDTGIKLDHLQDSAEKTGVELKNTSESADDTGKEVAEMGESAEKSSGGFTVLKGAVADLAADGFKKLVSAAKDAWDEIDEGYDTIVKKTGATGDTLKNMQSVADEVFTSLPVEMSDVGAAVGEINTRFGATDSLLKDLSVTFLEYSKINDTDVTSSVDNVSAAMRSFGLGAEQTNDVLGVLTDVSQKTGISTAALESLLTSNAATFKELELSIGESAQLLGQFEINGIDTSTALTGLKKAQQYAAAQGRDLSSALAETVESIKNADDHTAALQEATLLFGKKGAAEMVQAIQEERFSVDDLSDSIEGMGSLVKNTFEATQDAPDEMKKSLNALKLELAGLANRVLPYVQKYLAKFNDDLPKLKEKLEKFEPLVKGIGEVAGFVLDIVGGGFDILGNSVQETIGYQEHLNDIYEKGTQSARDYREQIEKQRSSVDELVESAKEQVAQDEAQINKTQALWDELQRLVDQNGNVKSGYEERVSYIVNELSKATDTEIEIIDGQIQKYDELKKVIDDTIAMQRAQVMLSANQGVYEEALKAQSSYASQYLEAEAEIEKQKRILNEYEAMARESAHKQGKDLSDAGAFAYSNQNGGWERTLNKDQWEKVAAAQDSITEYRATQKQLDRDLDYYLSVIDNYETANRQMLEGNYSLSEATSAKILDLSRDSLREVEGDVSDTSAEFKRQVTKALDEYVLNVKAKAPQAEDIAKKSVDEAVQYGLDNGLTGADMLKDGIIDRLSSIDSFNTSDLEAFMAQTGVTLGDILRENAYETLSGSMLSAVTDLLYQKNHLIVNSINSEGDYKAMKAGIYNVGEYHAHGGYISEGSRGIVAEAGPELIELINGSVKVTPLNRQARNTAISAGTQQKLFYNTYTINANIKGDYDVTRLAERLATEQRRIESGRGL